MAKFLLLFLLSLSFSAAQAGSLVKKDLPYRATSPDLTAYQKERCHLDLHYPDGAKDFATIIWFHGGGLTSGAKHFPAPLLDQGHDITNPAHPLLLEFVRKRITSTHQSNSK